MVHDVITYPLRGNGKYILALGTGLALARELTVFLPPFINFIAGVLLTGFLCATLFEIIQASASGVDEAPEFPEVTSVFEDLIWPMVQVVLIVLLSFAPWEAWGAWGEGAENRWLDQGFLLLGIVYCPMALLAVVVRGSLIAVSPHVVVLSIIRAGWAYGVAVLILALLYLMGDLAHGWLGDRRIVGTLILAPAGIFALMATGRTLGLVYRRREEQLAWV